MSSKLLISIIVGLVIGGGAAIFFFLLKPQMKSESVTLAPTSAVMPSPTEEPTVEMVKYQNDSGFSFEHPEEIAVKENTPGKTEYANLTITSSKNQGSITLKVDDTKLKDIEAWKKANKIDAATKTKEVQLADLTAVEQTLNSGKTTTVAIGDSVMYTFTVDPQDANIYWYTVYSQLVTSFAFELPESAEPASKPAAGSSGSSTDSDIILEEETIE
jgi:hypothetical protein